MCNGKYCVKFLFLFILNLSLYIDYCKSGLQTISETTTFDLKSPLYPKNYPVNLECFWYIITEPVGYSILISFIEFHTEVGFDNLVIGYGLNQSLDTVVIQLSGSELLSNLPQHASLTSLLVLPTSIIVKNEAMWLKFHSDRSKTYIGFHATIRSSLEGDSTFSISCSIHVVNSRRFQKSDEEHGLHVHSRKKEFPR